jgi:glutathione S-transferase
MAGKYKLFYSPGACSLAVHAVLNAIDADYDLLLTKIDGKQNQTEEYLKLNPLGQVPVLVEGENILKESAAIMMHLLDVAKHDLLPQAGAERIKAIQWLLFFNSTMHQSYSAYFLLSKNLPTSEEAKALITRRINKLWRYVESELKTDFLAGDKPTAGDLLMAVIANWLPHITINEKAKATCVRVSQLPYFARALEEERIKYRVIA